MAVAIDMVRRQGLHVLFEGFRRAKADGTCRAAVRRCVYLRCVQKCAVARPVAIYRVRRRVHRGGE